MAEVGDGREAWRHGLGEAITPRNGRDRAQRRAALLAEGIQLMDGKDAAGQRITKWEIKR